MQDAGVRDMVKRVLERHRDEERFLDGYWQWASNPTPPSAGGALEENGGFISTNLLTRYGRPAIDVVQIISDECREFRQEASVFDIRQAIIGVLNGAVGEKLRTGIVERLNEATPARRALAAWLVNRARWYIQPAPEIWLAGEFDWSLGIDLAAAGKDLTTEVMRGMYGTDAGLLDLTREALAVGVINRLFYRSLDGRMEPKLRPGPRIPLGLVAY